MTKRKLAYPSLLIALFIIFVTEGDILFGYTKPDNQKEAEEKETVAQPRYIYLSPHAKVSHFDRHFHQAAENNEIDWLLLAAVAYTESRFDSTAVSEVGAKGVMQMMPNTLRGLGIPDSLHADNEANIDASAQYLKELFRQYRHIKNPEERMNFVLASYNAGYGHINDAMRIADNLGHNRHKWEGHVDSCLVKKSLPEFYNDSTICRNGKFGDWKQTLSFVKKVNRHWKRFNNKQLEYMDSVNRVLASDTLKRIYRK